MHPDDFIEKVALQENAHLFFHFSQAIAFLFSQQPYLSAALHKPQQTLDGGGLTGAILADESHDTALGQCKTHILQSKSWILFA